MNTQKQHNHLTRFCETAVKTTQKFLKANPNVRVMPADKGNRTVIMDIEDYRTKMNTLLLDTNTYKQIKRDPTNRYQIMNNKIAQRMIDLKLIDQRTYYSLKTNTATCPRIYGQPKAHKPDLPLRPVVPNITAPAYNLSKFVSRILQSSIQSPYNVKDSFEFCQFINSVTLPPSYIMISLDVISLFTNIPHELVSTGIIENWQLIRTNTNICLDLFLEMITFCMECSYFQFDNKFYQQIAGTAMGNPLSPILAEIVMDTLINSVIRTFDTPIPIVKKYVDDLFLAVHQDTVPQVLNAFNNYHPKLQFTCEEEKNKQLPYLDILLIRKTDQTIHTQWYTKSIASGRLMNYYSFHPLSQKVNTAINFITRVDRLSTAYTNTQKYSVIRTHLSRNDYPTKLINRYWNRYINRNTTPTTIQTAPKLNCQPPNNTDGMPNQESALKNHQPSPTQTVTTHNSLQNSTNLPEQTTPTTMETSDDINRAQHPADNLAYRSIPYIADLSPRIAKILRREFSNVRIAYTNTNTVNTFLPIVKDTIPPLQKHNVIYSTKCKDCNSVYIGMTTNHLKTRLSGHQTTINQLEKLLSSGISTSDYQIRALREKTALIAHCIDNDHRFDLTTTQIIDHSYKKNSLPILEMCHIFNTQNSINKRTDVDNLNHTYAGILATLKPTNISNQNPSSRQHKHK